MPASGVQTGTSGGQNAPVQSNPPAGQVAGTAH